MGSDAEGDAHVQQLIQEGQTLLHQGCEEAARGKFDHAIDALYRDYQHYLFGLCLSLLRDPAWAEEVSHDTLVAAYSAMPTFRHQASVKTWLSAMCHKNIQQARRNTFRRHTLAAANYQQIREEVHPRGPVDPIQALLELLQEYGMHTWSPRDQTLFMQRFVEGYTLTELTTRWTTPGRVRKRLAKLVQRLRRQSTDG